MAYKPRTLFSLIEDINKCVFLPHIQRPFVWQMDQMVRLFDSLMRNYPIQTFLFWRTKEYIKARKFLQAIDWDAELSKLYDPQVSKEGTEKTFVLDGQQRLQTLYALFNGTILAPDAKTNLEAYFDVTSGDTVDDGLLKYRVQFLAADPGLPHYRLANLLSTDQQKRGLDIARKINSQLALSGPAADRVVENMLQLNALLYEERYFWVQVLDGVANAFPYKQILDIFIRVNSGGTRLDASDLMFAAMKEGWAEIEERAENEVEVLSGRNLDFDKEFVLKCLVVAHGRKAELDSEKFAGDAGEKLLAEMETEWPRAEKAFQELCDIINQELQLISPKVIRSYKSFVPLFDYLFHNPKPDERDRVRIRAYYYKSQLLNWYGSQTDGIINVLHGIVGKTQPEFPLAEIEAYFAGRGYEVTLREEHLDDARLRYILLNLIYVERFGKSPFNVRFKGNEPHIDHIYPQSGLRRLGLSTGEINRLGNFRFVGATDNIRKRAELPASYFKRMKDDAVNIENHLLVPEFAADPSKLVFDAPTYTAFTTKRRFECWKVADRVANAK
jgi:hypothetical protein